MKRKILKSSGEKVFFSPTKLNNSLLRSGVNRKTANWVLKEISNELYPGITTKQIYNRAFSMLKKSGECYASRYSLKKAIYEMGPSGFPFERFIAEIMKRDGYQVKIGELIEGKCVSHEVDVVAIKDRKRHLVECKFHNEEGRNCDVKIPLYIHSRFQDIHMSGKNYEEKEGQGWVVTNTRFTEDALQYGRCMGLYLLSWDYPENASLKKRIDSLKLYPVTVSTLLSMEEKQFLLGRDVVLASHLLSQPHYLDHLGISEERRRKVLNEFKSICNSKSNEKA
ncbi:restriction endonuclease [Christiangramia sediminis]|uniref:Restriction endonuclease n=1 Tax=Christiangramia sediminis TaxID=2881336 RepID=A0A9X1LH45_9FLAO|nr:restriction endonuclease [Christiangramia sediminis]MCB7480257.1 restriction endonuclease [Christiangramia sediminis]